ncbi:MAG: type II CAAX endopeptidase family protein [Actinomycetota bacterium]
MIEDTEEPATDRATGPRGLPAVTFRWWEALLAYVIGSLFLGGLAFAAMGASRADAAPIREVAGVIALDIVFLVSLMVWLRNVHPGSWAAIGIRWRARTAAVGVVFGAILYAVAAGALAFGLQWIYEQVVGHPVQAPEQMPQGLGDAGTVAFVILAVALAPVVEEVFFRGVLYRSIRDRFGVAAGLVGSSVVFGVVHVQPGPVADAVLLQSVMVFTGVGLALIYERAGNLLASIAAHAAFNAIGVTLILQARV